MTTEPALVPFALRLRRLVGAPPEAVFAAWTDATAVRHWLSAPGLAVVEARLDARSGGVLRLDVQAGAGGPLREPPVRELRGRYLGVVPPRRLCFTWTWDAVPETGAEERAGGAGAEPVVTVELRDASGMTELTLTHERLRSAASAGLHEDAWSDRLEALAEHLGGVRFDLAEARAVLERTPAVLDAMLRGLPGAWLSASEGRDTWNPRVVVGHLIHGERTDWIPRARLILARGEAAAFEPFDRFAQLQEPPAPLPALLLTFAAERTRSLRELDAMKLSPADLLRRGRHPELGAVTLRQLLATWVAHDFTHLTQVVRVMALRYRRDVGPWQAYLRVLRD